MKNYYLILILIFCVSCGSSSEETNDSLSNPDPTGGSDTGGSTSGGVSDEPILTDKLIGTPFEGMAIGDDVPWCQFLEAQYLTTTISEADLPIPIFLAFFTASEEEIVKHGVEVTNTAIGFNLYQVVDKWCDECRLILKVNIIKDQRAEELGIPESFYTDAIGFTVNYYYSFENLFSSTVVTDWAIEIKASQIKDYGWSTVAHELGHATGILYHFLIDYENDDLLDLETDSIMESSSSADPALNDFTDMMRKQFEILQTHYGLSEENPGGICP